MRIPLLLLTTLLSCGLHPGSAQAQGHTRPVADVQTQASSLPAMTVHRHPSCGCCGGWVEHMRAAGFPVQVNNVHDVMAPKRRLGVPDSHASCHTTEVGGYVVEGHVPASDILRLLREKPRARGLVLPGMPLGSPGMEVPDGRIEAFTVQLLGNDGSLRDYSQHPARPGKPAAAR